MNIKDIKRNTLAVGAAHSGHCMRSAPAHVHSFSDSWNKGRVGCSVTTGGIWFHGDVHVISFSLSESVERNLRKLNRIRILNEIGPMRAM